MKLISTTGAMYSKVFQLHSLDFLFDLSQVTMYFSLPFFGTPPDVIIRSSFISVCLASPFDNAPFCFGVGSMDCIFLFCRCWRNIAINCYQKKYVILHFRISLTKIALLSLVQNKFYKLLPPVPMVQLL